MNNSHVAMTVNVLIKKEAEMWVAHCLELDIVATAPTEQEVEADILDLISAQVDYAFSHGNLDHLFHPAPAQVWEEFYRCTDPDEKPVKVESSFRGEGSDFVPPWIIARTCRLSAACGV